MIGAKHHIHQTIITNGCLQALYISGDEDDDTPVKIYTEYLDIFLIFEGNISIKTFNKKMKISAGDLFFCTRSTYTEIFHSNKPFSYVRLRFLKDKLDSRMADKRFMTSFLNCEIIKQKIFNHCLSFIKFIEKSYETLPKNQAQVIHNENLEILSILEIMAAQEHEDLDVIPNKINRSTLIAKAIDIFEDNIETDIKISDITQQLQVSHSYFIRAFKQKLGVVPNVFWRTMKLNRSLSLLSLEMETLSDISYMLGFTDQSHFTNSFKKFMHVTPGSISH